jgi:hypothetical protein
MVIIQEERGENNRQRPALVEEKVIYDVRLTMLMILSGPATDDIQFPRDEIIRKRSHIV